MSQSLVVVPEVPDVPLADMTLEALAAVINEAHATAERRMQSSLEHARLAGVRLLEVKRRGLHGSFILWVKENCTFKHSTANLYMKVARDWDALQQSQHVENLSLRDAAQFLGHGTDDETEATADALYSFHLLTPTDVRGLAPAEVRTLVREVLAAYKDLCFDVDESTEAERTAQETWNPPLQMERRVLAGLAHETATALRDHRIGRSEVRARLRRLSCASGERSSGKTRGGAPLGRIVSRAPFTYYMELADRFINDSRTLLTSDYGLLDKRVELSPAECTRLIRRLGEVRDAIDTLEEQAQTHTERSVLSSQ